MNYQIAPYDPCPCGSGAKYKFCCAAKARHGKFSIGTVAWYGPDDKITTKIVASVLLKDFAEPIQERFSGENVNTDPAIADQIRRFFARHGVKNIVATNANLRCAHEEGIDYPDGEDCPLCPFWARKEASLELRADKSVDVIVHDDQELEDDGDDATDFDASIARSEAIVGAGDDTFEGAVKKYFAHLESHLQLPCQVSGREDFQWEERYVIGGWDPREYKKCKQTQPSYTNRFELLELLRDEWSKWMMCPEDIAARVRRMTDGKLFVLGLSELEVVDRTSPNWQLIDDYAIWFANSR